jgi:type I restriction enzyme S subunit
MSAFGWPTVKLESIRARKKYSLTGGPFGSNLVSRDYVPEGVPVIRGTNISGDDRFSYDDLVFVSEEKADELHQNNAHPGDIVFTQRGTLGQVGIIPQDSTFRRYVISQSQMKLTVDDSLADPLFIYYYFKWPNTVNRIKNLALSSGVPHTNLQILREFDIVLPPLPTQRKIAVALSAYDDLIENNARRIQILEEMAQAIYRQWFVEFRYPGHEDVPLVDSGTELGQIPEVWETKTLGDFGEVITGKTPSKKVDEYWNSCDAQFIRTPDMHDQFYCIETTDHLSLKGADSQSSKYLPPNSLCVSCIGTVGIVTITAIRAQTNQQINSIVLRDLSDLEFLYFSLLNLEETIKLYASTGATMANLSRGKFMALRVITPSKELRAKYHEITSPMFEQIKNLQQKSANLRITRDLLLPRLVSGEVDVSEVKIDYELRR